MNIRLLFLLSISFSGLNAQTKVIAAYHISESIDPNYCNIELSYADHGEIYLLENNKLLYRLNENFGDKFRTYYVGSYIQSDTSLTCRFNKCFRSGRSSRNIRMKAWEQHFIKIACSYEHTPYYARSSGNTAIMDFNRDFFVPRQKPTGFVLHTRREENFLEEIIEYKNLKRKLK